MNGAAFRLAYGLLFWAAISLVLIPQAHATSINEVLFSDLFPLAGEDRGEG